MIFSSTMPEMKNESKDLHHVLSNLSEAADNDDIGIAEEGGDA